MRYVFSCDETIATTEEQVTHHELVNDPPTGRAFPWNTAPSGQGSTECTWCGRFIYAPAVPCSVAPIPGLANLETSPGLGDRCKYEAATRVLG